MEGSSGKEGICTADNPSFGGPTVFNVVNSGHTLHMPGYDARLLNSAYWETRVTGPLAGSPDYPKGQGLFISFDVSIHNTGSVPLEFDQDAAAIDLLIAPTPSSSMYIGRPQIPYPDGAPGPQLDQEGAIPAGGTASGWVSFTAPLWERSRLNSPPTDLEFFRAYDPRQGYVGRIRLWKAANPAGRIAMSFHGPLTDPVPLG
jgi:hypothetical protein